MRAHVVYAGIKWGRGAANCRMGARANNVGERHKIMGTFGGKAPNSRHGLRAIDERQTFFGLEYDGRDARSLQRFFCTDALAADIGLSFANEQQGQMRERRQIARCSDAALTRHVWGNALIDERYERFQDPASYPRVPPSQGVGSENHQSPCFDLI